MIARACCILLLLMLGGCADLAEKAVNTAIKNCWTFDGFSDARQCPRR